MINLLRTIAFNLCNYIDDLVDDFNDFGFSDNDF